MSKEKTIDAMEYLINTPLYKKIDLTNIPPGIVSKILDFEGHLDCYCIECGNDSVFNTRQKPFRGDSGPSMFSRVQPIKSIYSDSHIKDVISKPVQGLSVVKGDARPPFHYKDKNYQIEAECSRNISHKIIFHLKVENNILLKIGQYPSITDLLRNKMAKYRKVLSNEKFNELITSYSLFTHGIGIGSFVYLRRIFEYLIEEIHIQYRNFEDWDEILYFNLRMTERIDLFKDFLPIFMVNNKIIYEIMSKGIHELSEEECLEYYNSISTGIELILTEKIKKQEDSKLIKSSESDLNKVHSKIAGKSKNAS